MTTKQDDPPRDERRDSDPSSTSEVETEGSTPGERGHSDDRTDGGSTPDEASQVEAPRGPNSSAITHEIQVEAAAQLLEGRSYPEQHRWIYAYRIRIANLGQVPQRLQSRHWVITDAHGETREVRGDGVVGEQPRLLPGEVHEYRSLCDLPTEWGTMEGSYRFVTDEGHERDVTVGRFFLVAKSENTIVVE